MSDRGLRRVLAFAKANPSSPGSCAMEADEQQFVHHDAEIH
jgi:hypothetical protein